MLPHEAMASKDLLSTLNRALQDWYRVGLVLLVLAGYPAWAQEAKTSGRIVYDVTRKLEIKLHGDTEGMSDMLPKEKKSQKELFFNQEGSLFKNTNKDQSEDAVNESAGGATVVIRIQEPDDMVYADLKNKKNLEQRDFMSRIFLIETDTDTARWKLTGNQKVILGYPCMEAELENATRKIVAWFAPSIPVSTGPDGFAGLPGLILGLDLENGKSTYQAVSVEMREVKKDELTRPKEGKKITLAEFEKIKEAKMKEMNQNSGGGVFIIKHEVEN